MKILSKASAWATVKWFFQSPAMPGRHESGAQDSSGSSGPVWPGPSQWGGSCLTTMPSGCLPGQGFLPPSAQDPVHQRQCPPGTPAHPRITAQTHIIASLPGVLACNLVIWLWTCLPVGHLGFPGGSSVRSSSLPSRSSEVLGCQPVEAAPWFPGAHPLGLLG